jgi:hypothetical protein
MTPAARKAKMFSRGRRERQVGVAFFLDIVVQQRMTMHRRVTTGGLQRGANRKHGFKGRARGSRRLRVHSDTVRCLPI